VRAESIIGDVDGRRTIIVDDMISTGATIEAAVRVLEAHGAQSEPIVVASHGLFVGSADRLRPLERFGAMIVSDSIPQCFDRNVTVCSIAPLLADAIGRLHNQQPLDELLLVT
jgi:ribose-phosphate pyrophosphokinase